MPTQYCGYKLEFYRLLVISKLLTAAIPRLDVKYELDGARVSLCTGLYSQASDDTGSLTHVANDLKDYSV